MHHLSHLSKSQDTVLALWSFGVCVSTRGIATVHVDTERIPGQCQARGVCQRLG